MHLSFKQTSVSLSLSSWYFRFTSSSSWGSCDISPSSQKQGKKKRITFYFLYSCNFVIGTMFCVNTDEGRGFVAQEKQTILVLGLYNLQRASGPCPKSWCPFPQLPQLPAAALLPSKLLHSWQSNWQRCVCCALLARRPKRKSMSSWLYYGLALGLFPLTLAITLSHSHIWLQMVSKPPK